MPEKGAPPNVHPVQRRVLKALESLSSPLLPDDYLELVNPLWSTRELRGRIQEVEHETARAATILIKPGYRWPSHRPGQYVRIGVDIDGVRHWRAYSLTSDPYREDGLISITLKRVDEGKVSPYLVSEAKPGTIVSLSKIEGDFVLPDPPPAQAPVHQRRQRHHPDHEHAPPPRSLGQLNDAVLLHSARHTDEVIFGPELRELARRRPGFRLHEQLTGEHGRMGPEDLDKSVPRLARARGLHLRPERHARRVHRALRARGPTASGCTWSASSRCSGWAERRGRGRQDQVPRVGREASSDGSKPILVAGEEAGLELPFGCREGICHTCVGELRSGKVRDLRNGKVYGQEGEVIRTCISAPEGPIEIDL